MLTVHIFNVDYRTFPNIFDAEQEEFNNKYTINLFKNQHCIVQYSRSLSLQVEVVMGTLNYSLGPFFPVRKVSTMILVKPHKRYNRLPSTLHDCVDNPAPATAFCRPWIVLILLLPLIFYVYRINGGGFYRMKQDTVIVVTNTTRAQVTKQTRGSDTRITMEIFDDATEDNGLSNIGTIKDNNDILPHNPPVCDMRNMFKKANVTINMNVSQEAAFLVNPLVAKGGYYKPPNCQTRHRIAIIVPYRHREENLAVFLTNIHQFLMNQQIEYRIFVIEQSGQEKFNKGRLLNAGFDQVKNDWECFVFHDVDLLPLDLRILYTCPSYPRYMSTSVYEGGQIINLTEFFGGVTAMSDRHFLAVNGYSNRFWGWGGEDNDMFWRIRLTNLPMMKYNKEIARYIMLPHASPEKNPKRYDILNKYSKSRARIMEDGVSTLKYTLVFKKLYPLFTHIVVDVNPYKDPTE